MDSYRNDPCFNRKPTDYDTMKTIPYQKEITQEQLLNIQEWIEELRSGRWDQCQGVLRFSDENYCCLGVACEINQVPHSMDKTSYIFNADDYAYTCETYPHRPWFFKMFGFESEEKVVKDDFMSYQLTNCNDTLKFNFDKIADIIEACFIKRAEIEIS